MHAHAYAIAKCIRVLIYVRVIRIRIYVRTRDIHTYKFPRNQPGTSLVLNFVPPDLDLL
jgi:hypothetical protein